MQEAEISGTTRNCVFQSKTICQAPCSIRKKINGKWYWLKSLLLGKFATPPMIKIYGTIGERRPATAAEIERGNRRLGRMKKLPGGKKLFGNMGFVRELRFHAFEEAKLPL